MITLKNNSKLCSALGILLLFSVLSVLFLQFDRNKLKTQISDTQTLLNSFIRDLNNRSKLEGVALYELLNIPKETLLSAISISGKEYSIFVVIDSIDCYTCFKFHITHVNEFSKKNIPIFAYSNLHSEFLKKSLIKSIKFPVKEIYKHKIIKDTNMTILLIDNKGKIIYADIADKTNYEKSKMFYNKINNFISNE